MNCSMKFNSKGHKIPSQHRERESFPNIMFSLCKTIKDDLFLYLNK